MAKTFTPQQLAVGPHSLRLPYQRRTTDQKTSLHWGQRKLLLSEIEFLGLFWDPVANPTPTCVYAGAAPGIHIPLLSQMFPAFTFHLYDPAEFRIQPSPKIQIFQQYFTDEVATSYAGRDDVFFLCDIRTADYKQNQIDVLKEHGITTFDTQGFPVGDAATIKRALDIASLKTEDQIWGDMQWQQTWVLLMNPVHAFLKFHLPYAIDGSKMVNYLKGTVYWQIWPPQTSTETRLKPVRNAAGQYEVGTWDILEYEQWNFYHNKVEREEITYLNPFTGGEDPVDPPELLNDYDSVAEAVILKSYFQKVGVTDPRGSQILPGSPAYPTQLYTKVKLLSRAITWSLNHERSEGRGTKSLSFIREAPVKSTSRSALDTYKAKTQGRQYTHKVFPHTKLTIDTTWRQPATPITLPPLGSVTLPPLSDIAPTTLPPLGSVALPPLSGVTPVSLPPLGGVTLPPLSGVTPTTLPPLSGITIPKSPGIVPSLGVTPVSLPPLGGITPTTLPPLSGMTIPKSPGVVAPVSLPPLGGGIVSPLGVTPVSLPPLGGVALPPLAGIAPTTLPPLSGMNIPKSPGVVLPLGVTPVSLPPLGSMTLPSLGSITPTTLPPLGGGPITIPRSPMASITIPKSPVAAITIPRSPVATITIPRSPVNPGMPVTLPPLGNLPRL